MTRHPMHYDSVEPGGCLCPDCPRAKPTDTTPVPLPLHEQFARFVFYNFGGWWRGHPSDLERARALRHVPGSVWSRVNDMACDYNRTGKLPEWCEVKL